MPAILIAISSALSGVLSLFGLGHKSTIAEITDLVSELVLLISALKGKGVSLEDQKAVLRKFTDGVSQLRDGDPTSVKEVAHEISERCSGNFCPSDTVKE